MFAKRLAFILVLICCLTALASAQGSEVSTNIIRRVFLIKFGDSFGTCFTIEVDGRQYLITAKHVLPNIKDVDSVDILRDDGWQRVDVKVIRVEPTEVDMIVLVPPTQLSPSFPLRVAFPGVLLGRNTYFLGYPFGLRMEEQ